MSWPRQRKKGRKDAGRPGAAPATGGILAISLSCWLAGCLPLHPPRAPAPEAFADAIDVWSSPIPLHHNPMDEAEGAFDRPPQAASPPPGSGVKPIILLPPPPAPASDQP
ncbi:MAG: hypothetical protein HQL51_14460, partial [Magnetococcales bacterium]|nr:hypothetical protein [Magnetococcales bacterium]